MADIEPHSTSPDPPIAPDPITRPGHVSVRPARDALEAFWAGELIRESYERGRRGSPAYREMVRDAEVRMRKAELFVAVDRTGQLIGSVTYVRAGTRYAIAAGPDEAELRMLAVTHHRRRRITERHLIQACITRASEDGCAGLLCFELRGKRLGWEFERVGFAQDRDRTLHPAPGIDLLTLRRRI